MKRLWNFFREKFGNMIVKQYPGTVSAIKIINDYGAFLESPAAKGGPGCIVDAKKLPWPKEHIKQAILTVLDSTSDAGMRDILVSGLIYLPYYQGGVGASSVGVDFSKLNHIKNIDDLASNVLHKTEEYEKFEYIIKSEQSEIKSIILSRDIHRLIDAIVAFNLNQGISNAIDAKLKFAEQALKHINENNDSAAITDLNAFQSAVLAQSGNHIQKGDVEDLITIAQMLITHLDS